MAAQHGAMLQTLGQQMSALRGQIQALGASFNQEAFTSANVAPVSLPVAVGESGFSPLITGKENDRRLMNGLCLFCGAKGHRAIACPF